MCQRRLWDLIMSGRTKYEALGSDFEPEKALGYDYEWKTEIGGSGIRL